jgi:hypothetical protein
MTININRQLLGVEDFLFGEGTVTQTRGGQSVSITKINAKNLPFDETQTLFQYLDSLDLTALADNINNINAVGSDLLSNNYISIVAASLLSGDLSTISGAIPTMESILTNIASINTISNDLNGDDTIGIVAQAKLDGHLDNITNNLLSIQNASTNASNSLAYSIVAGNAASGAQLSANSASLSAISASGYATTASLSSLSASGSATTATLKALEAEAFRLTADSYANEPEDTPVKIYTSNGDGTFTITNTSPAEYSALHYSLKSEAASLVGDAVVDSVKFTGGTGNQGLVSWNNDEETLDLVQNGAILQLGQELQWYCRNGTASTITEGTPVMATGTIGASGRITIAPWDPAVDIDGQLYLGAVTYDIAPGVDGKVTHFGKLRQLDTSAWNDGDKLWLDNSTVGAFTNIEPTSGIKILTGYVIHSDVNVGTIAIRVNNVDLNAYEPKDSTILRYADIGDTVQGYSIDITTQGNTFNGNSQLVQTTASGKMPALDGSNLTSLTESQITDLDKYTQSETDSLLNYKLDASGGTATNLIQAGTLTLATGTGGASIGGVPMQYLSAAANVTFTDGLSNGQQLKYVLVNNGYTLDSSVVTWWGGSAPTLGTTDEFEFYKLNGTLYGKHTGSM